MLMLPSIVASVVPRLNVNNETQHMYHSFQLPPPTLNDNAVAGPSRTVQYQPQPLGADPYLPRGLIESFLRVFKHFALKIPRGKVRVFLKKTLGVRSKKAQGVNSKKTQGANLKKAWGVFSGFSLKKPPGFFHNLTKINSEPLVQSSFIICSQYTLK